MKILFLHISDMHIKNKDGINGFQIKKSRILLINLVHLNRFS